jgi:hypothetical protein
MDVQINAAQDRDFRLAATAAVVLADAAQRNQGTERSVDTEEGADSVLTIAATAARPHWWFHP